MKLLKNVTIFALATVAIVSVSMAQASTITTTSDSVAAGSPATIHLDWDDGGAGNYRSVGTDLQFDATVLTSFNLDDCPAVGYTTGDGYFAANCTDQGGGVIRAGWALISGGVPTGRLGTIVFQTDPNATPGDYDISFLSVTVDQAAPTEVVGTVTILPPPAPAYGSTPAPGSTLDAGTWIQNSGPAIATLDINNDAGDDTSQLSGECEITSDTDNVFTFVDTGTDGPVSFGPINKTASEAVMFGCDTTAAFGVYAGTVSCTHDGDADGAASPVTYSLACEVTDGPQPNYSDTLSPDPMDLVAVEEADPDPMGTLTIFNTNGARDMNVTCSYTGSAEISLAQDGVLVVVPINGSVPLAVACDATSENSYAGSISCAHDATNVASPVVHPATCEVGPPGDAVYSSVEAPGFVYDLTPVGDPVPVGTVIPTQDLVITNAAEVGDRDLTLLNCGLVSDQPVGAEPQGDIPGISASQATSTLAPLASTTVTFSCDSSVVGDYVETYSCDYDVDGNAEPDGTASYTINCSVRAAESEVTQSPASGSPVTIYAPLGGSGQGSVSFNEILDEGEDGSVDSCTLADTTYFSIVSPASFPQPVPAGGSLSVVVEGMGTEDGNPTNTTLTCTYTDSQNVSATVSWPLDVVVQTTAIPTLSTWGMILMILTLLGLGGIVMRRKDLS